VAAAARLEATPSLSFCSRGRVITANANSYYVTHGVLRIQPLVRRDVRLCLPTMAGTEHGTTMLQYRPDTNLPSWHLCHYNGSVILD
jgi:hypothetical protein